MKMSPHQTQNESVQGDDVVFPDHVVEYFDALVELLSAGRRGELVDEEVGKRSHVSHQCTSPDTLQDPEGHKMRLQSTHHPNTTNSRWIN